MSYSLRSNDTLLLKPPTVKTLATLGDRAFVSAAPNYGIVYQLKLDMLNPLIVLNVN